MAKITYTDFLGDLGSLRFSYIPDEMFTDMEASGNGKAVYVDDFNGSKITLKGDNFAFLDGALLKGRVERVIFEDPDGNVTATVTGLDLKARQMDALLTEESFNLFNALEKMFGGDDAFTGTKNQDLAWTGTGDDTIRAFGGDDSINGQGGNDVMTGGGGSDHFFFLHEDKGGKDVITDFDATGAGQNQDYIAADFDDVLTIKQVGDDVVVDFGFGDRLTLRDTEKSDINEGDFHMPL